MSFETDYDFHLLKNEAEQMVLTELEKQLEERDPGICRCSECVLDMAAMALNAVKPLYRFSLLGTLYAAQAMNDESYASGVENAVAQAIDKVSSNPAHD